MYDETYPWRYAADTDANGYTTITRGRPYRLDFGDEWSSYWDDTDIVAFYDEGFRGLRVADWCDEEDGKRATVAYSAMNDHMTDDGALKRLAVRLTGTAHLRDNTPDFIRVGLDRGMDFYVLSWDGDPSGDWRREIEAVNNGEVYRMECERFVGPGLGWLTDDDDFCSAWYGDTYQSDWHAAYPLTEFPAEALIDGSN